MLVKNSDRRRLIIIAIILLIILIAVVLITDWQQLKDALKRAEWRAIPAAIGFSLLSYACVSYSFACISRLLGIKVNLLELTQIGFVSSALNHVITAGGVAGYSIRFLFLENAGVLFEEVMAASVFHFYLTSLIMLGMLPVSVVYLLAETSTPIGVSITLLLLSVLLLVIFVLASMVVFSGTARIKILKRLEKIIWFGSRRRIIPNFHQLNGSMDRGVKALRSHPAILALVILLIIVDWVSSVIALGYCFHAFGTAAKPGELISGFVIGTVAGVISMIPGGLGIQEGSTAGVFILMGSSFEQAFLASVLFRAVHYLFPFALSLVLYLHLIRKTGKQAHLKIERGEY